MSLPRGWHEGLTLNGKDIWISNGDKAKIWVIDTVSGNVISEIEPVAGFTEAIAIASDNQYYTTDWDEKKIYKARIENNKLIAISSVSTQEAHPAGVLWTGGNLFVITWTRGLGTKFDLLKMDGSMKLLSTINIQDIEEPDQLAWDGKNMWIASWYDQMVYKVDVNTWEILAGFRSPVSRTTGIAWDGKYMWLTGTYSDLYKLEIEEDTAMKITVTSSAFSEAGMIPVKYTGDGDEISPPISWSGIPAQAKSIALISDDPDAPMGTWVHWVIYNIPPKTNGLPENVPAVMKLDNDSLQGINSSKKIGYDSPYPPSGTHRYFFKVYALDTKLSLAPGATKEDLEEAMKSHILAQGQLMGRYSRK